MLTLLLYKMGLSEENVNAGIILIYVISTFAGGFVIGKLSGTRKFLWGLITGVLYFALLVLISFGSIIRSSQGQAVLQRPFCCAPAAECWAGWFRKKRVQNRNSCAIMLRADVREARKNRRVGHETHQDIKYTDT